MDTLRLGFARAEVMLDPGTGFLATPDGTDRFSGIEVFEFTDGRLVLDADDPAAQVMRLYRVALDRLPDDVGLAHWTWAVSGGVGLASVAGGFLDSTEFVTRFGALDDAGFAALLSAHIHAPDLALDIQDMLAAGLSRAAVLAEVADGWAARRATAADLAAGVWDQHAIAETVAILYHLALGRSPEAGGWAYWTGLWAGGMSAEAVASGVLHSAEFQARHGTPDAAGLVPLLLRETLGHTPSDAEVAPWLEAVRAGLDAPGLLLAMAEATALTAHFVPVMESGLLFA